MAQLLTPEAGPTTLIERLWGGRRLGKLRGGAAFADLPIGESWEFSTLEGHESLVGGQPLSAALGGPLPCLVKLIDTALPLSIQVHPDDGQVPGEPNGKEEAWVILDAEPGASLRCGLRPGVDFEAFARACRDAVADPDTHGSTVVESLRAIPIQRGTVIVTPARTVHAIGAGVLLAEIQQPSDCTLRLHDYGSGRPIHVEDALAVMDPGAQPIVWQPGDPVRRLAGKHVEVVPVGPSEHGIGSSAPHLIVAVDGTTEVVGHEQRVELPAGDLRLVTGGGWSVRATGLAVVGSVDAT